MSLLTIMREFFRFIKDFFFQIIFGAIIFSLVMVAGRYYLSGPPQEAEEEFYTPLLHVFEQEPAYFRALIYNDLEDQPYSNSFAIDEYFSSDDVLEELYDQTGVDAGAVLAWQEALELERDSDYRGAIAGIRDSSSHIMTFRFQVGQTAEENLAAAKFYQEVLEQGEVPFLDHQKTYLVEPATLGEAIKEDRFHMVSSPDLLNLYTGVSKKTLVLYGGLGLMIGAFVMVVILMVVRLLKPKINYAFEYTWDFEDQQVIVQAQELSSQDLEALIQTPPLASRIVLVQTHESSDIVVNEEDAVVYAHSLLDLNPLELQPQEIVLMVYSNQTDKAWYKHQAMLSHLYRVPLKIIQIIQ